MENYIPNYINIINPIYNALHNIKDYIYNDKYIHII